MAGICVPTDLPRITDPALLSSPACLAINTWDLMAGADVRGASILVPHLPGRTPVPLLADETNHKLQLIIVGDVDETGDSRGLSGGEGLEATLNDLRAIVDPDGTTGSTWTLTTPSGAARTANVQPLRLTPGSVVEGVDWLGVIGMAMTAVLDIRLSDGLFV